MRWNSIHTKKPLVALTLGAALMVLPPQVFGGTSSPQSLSSPFGPVEVTAALDEDGEPPLPPRLLAMGGGGGGAGGDGGAGAGEGGAVGAGMGAGMGSAGDSAGAGMGDGMGTATGEHGGTGSGAGTGLGMSSPANSGHDGPAPVPGEEHNLGNPTMLMDSPPTGERL